MVGGGAGWLGGFAGGRGRGASGLRSTLANPWNGPGTVTGCCGRCCAIAGAASARNATVTDTHELPPAVLTAAVIAQFARVLQQHRQQIDDRDVGRQRQIDAGGRRDHDHAAVGA